MRLCYVFVSCLMVVFFASSVGATSSAVFCEGVSDYSYLYGDHSHDIGGATSAYDFKTGLPSSIYPTSTRTLYTDSSVFDTDIIDTARNSSGQDNYYWDKGGLAVSYFSGHGKCPVSIAPPGWCPANNDTNCPCSYGYQCPSGMQCQVRPDGNGTCNNENASTLVTSSPGDSNGHAVRYWSGVAEMALGEGSYPINWAGVGTAGGTNIAILNTSCGAQPNYFWYGQRPMFAGVHSVFSQLVVYGDVSGGYQWGGILASIISANVNAAASTAWFDAMGQVTVGGAACPGNGGWNGYSGCGANLVVSWAESTSMAYWHVATETWYLGRSDTSDALGNGYAQALLRCNYDCNTYPMTR